MITCARGAVIISNVLLSPHHDVSLQCQSQCHYLLTFVPKMANQHSHTPSPHRFVTKRVLNAQQPVPKSASNPRHVIATPQPKTANALTSRQFKSTPRFSVKPSDSHAALDITPTRPSVHPASSNLNCTESIDDASQEEKREDGADSNLIMESIEYIYHPDNEQDTIYERAGDKRRRISPDPSLSLPYLSASVSSQAPHTAITAAATSTTTATPRRFVIAPPSSLAGASRLPTAEHSAQQQAHSILSSRPAFVKPPPPPLTNEHEETLPDAFSPHRRGQKYVVGGLADTVRGWIVEAAGQGYGQGHQSGAGRRGKGDMADAEEVVRVKVGEVAGHEGMRMVRGKTVEDREVRVLLAGSGKSQRGNSEMRPGVVLMVAKPSWEIDVAAEKWVIGVDWKVLKETERGNEAPDWRDLKGAYMAR